MLGPQLLVCQDSESPPAHHDHWHPWLSLGSMAGGGILRPKTPHPGQGPGNWPSAPCLGLYPGRREPGLGGHRTGKQPPGEAGPGALGVKVPGASLAAASKSSVINKVHREAFFFLLLSLRQIPK